MWSPNLHFLLDRPAFGAQKNMTGIRNSLVESMLFLPLAQRSWLRFWFQGDYGTYVGSIIDSYYNSGIQGIDSDWNRFWWNPPRVSYIYHSPRKGGGKLKPPLLFLIDKTKTAARSAAKFGTYMPNYPQWIKTYFVKIVSLQISKVKVTRPGQTMDLYKTVCVNIKDDFYSVKRNSYLKV